MTVTHPPPGELPAFDDERQIQRVVEVLKAIAHPLRLRIVSVLCRRPEHVNGLAERLDANQAVVSQQLRILRMSGLVDATRQGGFAVYRVIEPRLRDILRCVHGCQGRP